jgi:hypothetical protein
MSEGRLEYEACAADPNATPREQSLTGLESCELGALTLEALGNWPRLEVLATAWTALAGALDPRISERESLILRRAFFRMSGYHEDDFPPASDPLNQP